MHGDRTRDALVVTGLAGALVAMMLIAAAVGPMAIAPERVFGALLRPIGLTDSGLSHEQAQVLLTLRLPRIALAALTGAALAIAGASLQGLFRNPLVDPGLIGVSSGSALGVAIVLVGASAFTALPAWFQPLLLPVAAFGGGIAATLLVHRLATSGRRTDTALLLLAGLAVNALVGALLGLASVVSTDAQLRNFTFWTFGGLGGATWTSVLSVLVIAGVSAFLLVRQSSALDAFLIGEAEAAHLGHRVERVRRTTIAAAALAVGATVAVAGLIGFVGLVVPHLVRLVLGPLHARLLPAAALLGAALLVLADTVARTVIAPAELPVGIVTALIGAPFFMALLIGNRRRSIE
jgi:iron complex transport system permease protein